MGQTSIAMLNKVGYSMFWNSMWDNKILYNRLLKEDIFIEKFFKLTFNDSLSINLINLKKINKKTFLNYNYNIDSKKSSLYKHIMNNNKINYFSSKIWVLKYQKWVIIYQFIYILKNINNEGDSNADYIYNSNISILFKYFNKSNNEIKKNCKSLKKSNKHFFF